MEARGSWAKLPIFEHVQSVVKGMSSLAMDLAVYAESSSSSSSVI